MATSRTNYTAGDTRQGNIVGTYDFSLAKVGAQISRDKNGALRWAMCTTWVSALPCRHLGWPEERRGASIGLNGVHTAANGSSNGLDLGVRHTF